MPRRRGCRRPRAVLTTGRSSMALGAWSRGDDDVAPGTRPLKRATGAVARTEANRLFAEDSDRPSTVVHRNQQKDCSRLDSDIRDRGPEWRLPRSPVVRRLQPRSTAAPLSPVTRPWPARGGSLMTPCARGDRLYPTHCGPTRRANRRPKPVLQRREPSRRKGETPDVLVIPQRLHELRH
jgi:hypothetical protein